MRQSARRVVLTLVFCLVAGGALGQSHLRIGLGDDPDVLDPSLSRTYTARIVFAADVSCLPDGTLFVSTRDRGDESCLGSIKILISSGLITGSP